MPDTCRPWQRIQKTGCAPRVFRIIAWLCISATLCVDSTGHAAHHNAGILLADDTGHILYAKNDGQQYIPASILKILTALTALETLGPDYRFHTLAGYHPATCNLYIKGLGDPLFISEQIQNLVNQLSQPLKTRPINDIILDHSFFGPEIRIPGTGGSTNPYDAPTGALSANFNTIFFKWDQFANQFVSAEPQTPLPSLFTPEIVESGLKTGRIILTGIKQRIYPGLLIKAFLEQKAFKISGTIKLGRAPETGLMQLTFTSEYPLKTAIKKMLKFSNNFMANQIMLTMGALKFGTPATCEKGVTHLKQFAATRLDINPLVLAEGSGLSRQNRLSPRQMLKLLMAFQPYHTLLRQQGNEFYKTGTLQDVRTRAGYFKGKDQRLYPFVIMINGHSKGYSNIRQMLKKKVAAITASPGPL